MNLEGGPEEELQLASTKVWGEGLEFEKRGLDREACIAGTDEFGLPVVLDKKGYLKWHP